MASPRLVLVALSALAAGCSASGSGLTLFPLTHRLAEDAERLRAAQPQPIAAPRELQKSVATELRVEPGDVLGFALAEPEDGIELPPDQPALADGTIDLGPFGRLVVAYRTLAEIEDLVGESLTAQVRAREREAHAKAEAERRKKDPKAKAAPAPAEHPPLRVLARFAPRPSSKVVYVFGEVANPGAFALEGRETVLDALVAAGGLTRASDHAGIVLARPSAPCEPRTVLPICYDRIVQLGDTSTNYQALAGDRIYVPGLTLCERMFPKRRRPECPPCVGPQTAKALPALDCGSACAPLPAPTALPALIALPARNIGVAPIDGPPAVPMPEPAKTPAPPAKEPAKLPAEKGPLTMLQRDAEPLRAFALPPLLPVANVAAPPAAETPLAPAAPRPLDEAAYRIDFNRR